MPKRKNRKAWKWAVAVALVLAGMAAILRFGVDAADQTVEVERIVALPRDAVLARLASPESLAALPWPFFLRLGFPLPVAATGGGLNQGEQTRIFFASNQTPRGEQLWQLSEIGTYSYLWQLDEDRHR